MLSKCFHRNTQIANEALKWAYLGSCTKKPRVFVFKAVFRNGKKYSAILSNNDVAKNVMSILRNYCSLQSAASYILDSAASYILASSEAQLIRKGKKKRKKTLEPQEKFS